MWMISDHKYCLSSLLSISLHFEGGVISVTNAFHITGGYHQPGNSACVE